MFRRSVRTLATTSAVLVTALSAAVSASAASSGRVWFPRDLLPLAHVTKLGAANPSQRMEVGIGLKDPNAAAERSLMSAQQNPASSQYQHFLTPAQFDARFAVPKATFSKTLAYVRAGGARVLDTSGARNFVEISATVKQLDSLFATKIGRYQGSSQLGRSAAPSALKTIAGEGSLLASITSKLGVAGLLGKTALPGIGTAAAGTPQIPAELTPQDMWSIYDMPSNNIGQGQSVAIMGSGDSSTTVKDLGIFETRHKLPKVPVTVTKIPADGDFSDTGGNVEWELDTQSSTGVAPGVKSVHLYFAQHLIDPDAEADFANWVDDPNGPKQANASFGECETSPANATLESTIPTQFNNNQDQNALYGTGAPNALEPVADQTLRQGVLEGRTLFAATGDTGSSCAVLVLGPELGAGNGVLNQGVPIVNYPAASPYVVAVGGTVLYPDGSTPAQRGLEYPWPYTGGGQSFFISEPSFQKGVSNINRPCLSSVSGTPNTSLGTCRGIPDVAAESGDIATSGYDIYSDELGGASEEGGTSLSSPLMAGMWARIQAAASGGTGFADPQIYAVAKQAADYSRDFNDYSLGTNGAYQAGTGWDYVSGWGTPVLTSLMKDIDHGNTAPIQGH